MPPETIPVSLRSLADLAVECWRLERLLAERAGNPGEMGLRRISRIFAMVVKESEIEIVDLTNCPYDAGLAVEVVEILEAAGAGVGGQATIVEVISPVILWRGMVLRSGRVAIGKAAEREE